MPTNLHEFEKCYLESKQKYSEKEPDLSIAPKSIKDIFERYGLSHFKNGFLWLIDPIDNKQAYHPWFDLISRTENYITSADAYPFMRTAFGDCFFFKGNQLGFFSMSTGVVNYLDVNFYFNKTLTDRNTLHGIYLFDIFSEFIKESEPITERECLGFLPPLSLGREISQDHIKKMRLTEHLVFLADLLPTP